MGNEASSKKKPDPNKDPLQKEINTAHLEVANNTVCFTDDLDTYNKHFETSLEPDQDQDSNYYQLKVALENLDMKKVAELLENNIFDMTYNISNLNFIRKAVYKYKIQVVTNKDPRKEKLYFLQSVKKIFTNYLGYISYSRLLFYKKLDIPNVTFGQKVDYADVTLSFVKPFAVPVNSSLLDCILACYAETNREHIDVIDYCLDMIVDANQPIDSILCDKILNNLKHKHLAKVAWTFVKYNCKLDLTNKIFALLLKNHKKSTVADDVINIIVTDLIDATLVSNRGTWLHYIAHACDSYSDIFIEKTVEYLVKKGCSVNIINSKGDSVLKILMRKKNVRLLEYLLDNFEFTDEVFRDAYYLVQIPMKNTSVKKAKIKDLFEQYMKIRRSKKIHDHIPEAIVEMEDRVNKIRENIKNVEDDIDEKKEKCSICFDEPVGDFVFVPCGHKRFCDTCVSIIKSKKSCPICKAKVQSVIKVY